MFKLVLDIDIILSLKLIIGFQTQNIIKLILNDN